jgi:hypothetical protein
MTAANKVADLAELIPDVLGRPGGLDGIGIAQVQQHPVRHPAHVRAVGRAEGGQGAHAAARSPRRFLRASIRTAIWVR